MSEKSNEMPTCVNCGKVMRYNVPRLGPDGGFVHANTGKLQCENETPTPKTDANKFAVAIFVDGKFHRYQTVTTVEHSEQLESELLSLVPKYELAKSALEEMSIPVDGSMYARRKARETLDKLNNK